MLVSIRGAFETNMPVNRQIPGAWSGVKLVV